MEVAFPTTHGEESSATRTGHHIRGSRGEEVVLDNEAVLVADLWGEEMEKQGSLQAADGFCFPFCHFPLSFFHCLAVWEEGDKGAPI